MSYFNLQKFIQYLISKPKPKTSVSPTTTNKQKDYHDIGYTRISLSKFILS